ncbi:helix-turn-helix transcriptional regulator [Actinoplanes sp. RD1]|uniref:helix-turn-helix transcriptional regulator n=1 Tax=Actinoplanes sp. RD1 TaxID=3064538 RepID=UPI0027426550|nr:LuxR C-terminal-related transcriptional regulator [Actinoplanes sp. RD1]
MSSTPVPMGAAVPSLVRWGLTSDADLVYRTLVTFGPSTERCLALDLGLSARRTAQALAELRECGAAAATPDPRTTVRLWTPAQPAAVVQRLRARRLNRVDPAEKLRSHQAVLRSSGLLALLGPGKLPPLRGEVAAGIRYLDTRPRTRDRIAELLRNPISDFWTMTTEQAVDAESARAAAPLDTKLYARGTHCRLLAPPVADGDALDVSGHLIDGRLYQRLDSADVPLRLMMIDRRIALLPADPANLERGWLEISHPDLFRSLVIVYNRHWDTAAASRREVFTPINLSDRERTLVTLLAAGHTDRTAAEQLRISPRSVTGTLRVLMDRLGVENRFQLGVALGGLQAAVPPAMMSDVSSTHGE